MVGFVKICMQGKKRCPEAPLKLIHIQNLFGFLKLWSDTQMCTESRTNCQNKTHQCRWKQSQYVSPAFGRFGRMWPRLPGHHAARVHQEVWAGNQVLHPIFPHLHVCLHLLLLQASPSAHPLPLLPPQRHLHDGLRLHDPCSCCWKVSFSTGPVCLTPHKASRFTFSNFEHLGFRMTLLPHITSKVPGSLSPTGLQQDGHRFKLSSQVDLFS